MSFNLKKYLVENNLTVISKKRQALKEEEDQPSSADLEAGEKQFKDSNRDKIINFSRSTIKPLLNLLQNKEISLEDYKAELEKASKEQLGMNIASVFKKLKSYKKVDAPEEQD